MGSLTSSLAQTVLVSALWPFKGTPHAPAEIGVGLPHRMQGLRLLENGYFCERDFEATTKDGTKARRVEPTQALRGQIWGVSSGLRAIPPPATPALREGR